MSSPRQTSRASHDQPACPALLISAPASGHGKTTITAALARLHSRRGLKVRVFKCGPDFLDPMILEKASGNPVYQLDLWIQGESECRRLLGEAAETADLILVEGVMGLYDGQPSAADLACLFNIPVLACIDASAMAGTFAALAHGLASYRSGLPFAGVFANRLGSARHAEILRGCLPTHLPWYGGIFRSEEISLPSRHLGLVQAAELEDLERRLDRLADLLEENGDFRLPQPVHFHASSPGFSISTDLEKRDSSAECSVTGRELAGMRIGIARDAAFSFIYQANLDLLRALGAELLFFSPLSQEKLPEVNNLYLPGGYPELHLPELSGNQAMLEGIRLHYQAGKPILAECGGMLYLLESLTDHAGNTSEMAGLLPGRARMQKRLAALGSQEVTLPEGVLRGHTFHHSVLETELPELTRGIHPGGKSGPPRAGEAVYRLGSLTASYIHFYFPSNALATARLFLPAAPQAPVKTVPFSGENKV